MELNSESLFVTFTRASLTGLFIGIIDTVILLAFNIFYREYTGYIPSAIVNVSSIIFAVNLLLYIAGMVYFIFMRIFGKNDIVFTLFMLLLTAYLGWQTENMHHFTDAADNTHFKGLILSIVLLLGVTASTIPYCLRSNFFDKHVL